MGADGDEIIPISSVIIIFQSDGLASAFFVKCHVFYS